MSKEPKVRKDHNGGVTGDVLAKHLRELGKISRAQSDLSNRKKALKKVAEEDGINFADMVQADKDSRRDPQSLIDERNRQTSYLKLMRADVGEQLTFIDDVGDSTSLTDDQRLKKWWNDGYRAGLAGDNRDTCPHDPNSEAGRQWMLGYEEGQGKNLSGITDGKGNAAVPPKPGRGRKARAAPANDPTPPAGEEQGGEEEDADEGEGDDAPPIPPAASGAGADTRH